MMEALSTSEISVNVFHGAKTEDNDLRARNENLTTHQYFITFSPLLMSKTRDKDSELWLEM
jgi:hypothetical protein